LAYYFAPISEGLGDLLVTLPALQALINTGVPTYLVLRSPKQDGVVELIAGLAGVYKENDFMQLKLASTDTFINMRDHPLQTAHVFGSDNFFNAFGRITIVDICRRICKDLIVDKLQLDCNFDTYAPFPFDLDSRASGSILLVPGSAGAFKCWSASAWMELHHKLKVMGIPSFMLGQPDKSAEVRELVDLGLPWLPTDSLATALNLISSARAMVAVDTGLLHLAIQQGIPSVGLYIERSIFHRPQSNCYPIFAPDLCQDCPLWTGIPPTTDVYFASHGETDFAPCAQPAGERCVEQISVEAVLKRLLRDALKTVESVTCSSNC